MINYIIVAVCYFCCISITSSAPLVKKSDIHWTEPEGTGNGNITFLVFPQDDSVSRNNSDTIVAVKSDIQVISEDTKLINLVVKERQSGERTSTNERQNGARTPTNEKQNSECNRNNERRNGECTSTNERQNGEFTSTDNHKDDCMNSSQSEEESTTLNNQNTANCKSKTGHHRHKNIFKFLKPIFHRGDKKSQTDKTKHNFSQTTENLISLMAEHEYFNRPKPTGSTVDVYQLIMNLTDTNSEKVQFDENKRILSESTEMKIHIPRKLNGTDYQGTMSPSEITAKQFRKRTSTENTINVFNFLNSIKKNNCSDYGGQMRETDLNVALVDSSMPFQSNGNLKGPFKPIPDLNMSSYLHSKSNYVNEKVADIYSDNNIENNVQVKPIVLQNVDENKIVEDSVPIKGKVLMDTNNIFMQFAGKNIISEPKFRPDVVSEKNCEPTPEIETDSELESDEDLETEPVTRVTSVTQNESSQTTPTLATVVAMEEQTIPQTKTSTDEIESNEQTRMQDIPDSSSTKKISVTYRSSTELKFEKSSKVVSIKTSTQEIVSLSTTSAVNEYPINQETVEKQTVPPTKTSIDQIESSDQTNGSPVNGVEENSTEPQLGLATTKLPLSKDYDGNSEENKITQKDEILPTEVTQNTGSLSTTELPLSKDYDRNSEDSLGTQSNQKVNNMITQKDEILLPTEMTQDTGSMTTSTPVYLPAENMASQTIEKKPKQVKTCEKTVYIPNNSVKEVIIQLVKYTKKPENKSLAPNLVTAEMYQENRNVFK